MAKQQGISLAQAASGGLIDDIDVTIADAQFAEWDYNGAIPQPVLALAVQFEDGDGKTYDQYYSAGDLQYFVPSDDGSMAIPVGDKQLINDNTNAWKFLASLMEQGFPADKLESGSVKAFVGCKVHVNRVAQPKRQGLIRGGKNADRESTVLLVTQIISMPGEGAGAKKAAGKAATGRPSTATTQRPALGAAGKNKTVSSAKPNGQAEAGDEVEEQATSLLLGILNDAGEPVAKKQLSTLSFRAAKAAGLDGKQTTKVSQLLFRDAFLHQLAENGMITYDGSEVGLPE